MPKKKFEDKLTTNLTRVVQQFIQGKGYTPLSFAELMTRLGFPPQHKDTVKAILAELIKEGTLELANGRYTLRRKGQEIVTGILRVHPRGFGFLQPENTRMYDEDIFIPKHLTMNAVDGDTVEVAVNTESVSEKGPEGKVISILERGRTHIAGIVKKIELDGDIIAYVPLLGTSKRVIVQAANDLTLRAGDRIVMEVIDWGSKETEATAKLSHIMGHIEDPSCDIPAAIEEYELRADFPSRVVQEAEAFGSKVSAKDLKGREDLRNIECFTIDPDTAKDFDDAVSLTKDSAGNYHLGVHIADVSHYVRPDSALDVEARKRCNSTYFPGFALPMLPRELSDNLCSLKANVIRLTSSVFVDFDPMGNMMNYRIARTYIKSARRFTYREAFDVIEGRKKNPHAKTLHLMVELCKLLKRKRYERGSIEFSLPELVVVVDEKGEPVKTDYVAYDITHQMIEEFMLKANEIVAWHLSNQGKDITYRVHDEPAEENMRDFAVLAGAFGFRLSDKPTSAELQKMFDKALDTPFGPYLATSFIRRMRLAVYSPENIGHYGLGLTHYCHFTSPIRRYVDLVVHRILFGQEGDREDLHHIATLCSEQERISARAESSVVLLKKLRLLKKFYDADPAREFEAVVTRIKPFGLTFEVLDLMLEGFLHVSELEEDYFIYDEARMNLRGRSTGKLYAPGQRIKVSLKSVDFILAESEWFLITEHPRKHKEHVRKEKPVEKAKKKVSKKPPLNSFGPKKIKKPSRKKKSHSQGKKKRKQ
jgi:ribonuclease R